jgi:hypothetical protein
MSDLETGLLGLCILMFACMLARVGASIAPKSSVGQDLAAATDKGGPLKFAIVLVVIALLIIYVLPLVSVPTLK